MRVPALWMLSLLACGDSTHTDDDPGTDTQSDSGTACPAEVCDNGEDDDCDGDVDRLDADCQVDGVVLRATFFENKRGAPAQALAPRPGGGVFAAVVSSKAYETSITGLDSVQSDSILVAFDAGGEASKAVAQSHVPAHLLHDGTELIVASAYRAAGRWGDVDLPAPSRDLAWALARTDDDGLAHEVVRLDSSQDVDVWSIATLPEGGMAAVGNFIPDMRMHGANSGSLSANGNSHLYVASWSADGKVETLRTVEGVLRNGGGPNVLAAGADGSLWIAGQTFGTFATFPGPDGSPLPLHPAGKQDAFVTKMTADGRFAWLLQLTSAEDDTVYQIAPTADGGACIVGQAWHDLTLGAGHDDAVTYAGTGPRPYVVRVDGDGNILWSDVLQSTAEPAEWVLGTNGGVLAMSDGGCLWYLGIDGYGSRGGPVTLRKGEPDAHEFSVGRDWDDVALARYTSTGALSWARAYSGASRAYPSHIAMGDDHLIYISGGSFDTFSVDPVYGTGEVTSGDDFSGFILAIAP